MTPPPALSDEEIDRLRQLDSCTVSNTIERFAVRLRNEGFMHGSFHCQFPRLGPIVGYAVTGRIRSSSAPMTGRCYYDHLDWWNYVRTIPQPRIIVMQDIDRSPGIGAFFGELHANICLALGCVAYITNGAVRDLDAVEAAGFQLFAGSVCVSHAYAHIAEFGEPVEVAGLKVRPGDLLHGDRHGVVNVPLPVAAQIPAEAAALLAEEREFIALSRSPDFSLEKLEEKIRKAAERQPLRGGSL